MALKRLRLIAVAGLGALLSLGTASRATAQGHTPDPFNGVGDYNIGLAPFLYSTYPNPEAIIPNQAALQGRSGLRESNRFADYLDDINGGDLGDRSRSSRGRAGVSYSESYRSFDDQYRRNYVPNEDADRGYYEGRQDREAIYAKYLRESDPKRRAQLYREYSQANARSARLLSGARATTGRSKAGSSSEPPPPPPSDRSLGPVAPNRSRTPRPTAGTGTTPTATDILQRSERLERTRPASTPTPAGPSRTPR